MNKTIKNNSMRKIYNIPGTEVTSGEMCESIGNEMTSNNVEGKFVESVVDIIIETLDIGHRDRRIVQPLLLKVLGDKLDKRWKDEGLLQQYQAYILETAKERIMNTLDIPKEIKVNHSHGTHAKYADIVDYIKAEDKEAWLEKYKTKHAILK